jgi:Tol biopolymer transport system component
MGLTVGGQLGPYQVVGYLGAGGMGVVYRARDPRLGREVAIKVLPDALARDPRRLERLRQEARAVAALDHPNILSVHDVGTENGVPFVVFELLKGETLRSRLQQGALARRDALELAVQVARGLRAAHRRGIVHRDIKPENLFLASGGLLKILDFGLAIASGREDHTTSAEQTASAPTEDRRRGGTAAYMSPEQACGQALDARSDLFSLGVVLHEMLTGANPFQRETTEETVVAILRESPAPVCEAAAGSMPGIAMILARCLAKDPDDRFQSAADLEFSLGQALGPHDPNARETTRTAPLARVPWALAAVALAAALVSGVLLWRASPRPPTFERLTFRRGTIWSARFAPDGQTVVYSASWEGHPVELFETRVGSTESRPLGLGAANVLSISPNGEMALTLNPEFSYTFVHPGTLARAALSGGAPREMARPVFGADWMPDGREIAFSKIVKGKWRLELSSGQVLGETTGNLYDLRVAPDGACFAFFQNSKENRASVVVLDSRGKMRVLSSGWEYLSLGLAWAPSGREVWFTGARDSGGAALRAVDLSGHERVVANVPGGFQLQDVFRDGRVLLSHVRLRAGLACLSPGAAHERDLSWLDSSFLGDLSPDGRTIVFAGRSPAGGYSIYLQGTNGSPAIRLGDGAERTGMTLSPNGQWVLTNSGGAMSPTTQLLLLPTGPGPTRRLPRADFVAFGPLSRGWLPDASAVIFLGQKAGKEPTVYLEDLASGATRPIASGLAWLQGLVVAPDGRSLAAVRPDGTLAAYAIDGSGSRPVSGRFEDDVLIGWSSDGRSLYSYRVGDLPGRIYRIDIKTGARTVWKELMPADPAGVWRIHPVRVTPDGRSYAYTYNRWLDDLYVYEGLK